MKTDTREIRKTRPGFNVVTFVNCEVRDGRPVKATAEKIVKTWKPTRAAAEAAL